MNLDALLALFTALNRHGVEYAVAGDLADLMRGRVGLTEQLEIVVTPEHVERARDEIGQVWPDSKIVDSSHARMRVLPPNTPFYVDVIARSVTNVELMHVRDVLVRVASDEPMRDAREVWSRPGFTLRERLAALHGMTRELMPSHAIAGVRKFRSIEVANADRERWDRERADRVRAERLRRS